MKNLIIACFLLSALTLGATEKPNILFIAIDDLRPELGCYGATPVKSPHIDKFAAEGMVFTRAYCQVPVCGASRASLLTGILPTRKRFVSFDTQLEKDAPGVMTLPESFRKAGYTTESAKKPEPFLLYFSLTSPHTPLSVNEEWIGKSGLGPYGDFVMETDAIVGRVLAALDESGTAENTLVIFTSDNGCAHYIGMAELEAKGHFASGPLRGAKSDAWEGGKDPARKTAVSNSISGVPAVRDGHWKYIAAPGSGGWGKGGDQSQPVQLYNLSEDLGETKNLAAAMPEKLVEMKALFEILITEGRSTPGPKQDNDAKVVRYPR